MDVTPHQLRTIELREAWRGYRQDDVDELLDQVAGTIERLQAHVKRLTERLAKVEDEAGLGREADEMLRRTLLLAQRTADAAVSEAQERARRVLSESEVQAHSIVSGAEEEARRVAIAERQRLEGEVRELARRRDALLADVDALDEAAGDHRRRLRDFLEAEISRIETRPMPAVPIRPELREEPPDAVPSAESRDETPEAAPAAEAPAETADPPQEELDRASNGASGDDSTEAADLDERADEFADDDADLDAFADLDAGMADLLPRRRRRRRRPVDDEVDDEFFSELRAAVSDAAPLGPTDDDVEEIREIDTADTADTTDAADGPEVNEVEGAPEESAVEAREVDDEIMLEEAAGSAHPAVPAEEPVFFDQDETDADDRNFDETRDWGGFDDGIPDGGRLRSVFRRHG